MSVNFLYVMQTHLNQEAVPHHDPSFDSPTKKPKSKFASPPHFRDDSDDDIEVVGLQIAAQPSNADEDRKHGVVLGKAMLEKHALTEKMIAGDGNCFFRSVAVQLPEGEKYHVALRKAAVKEVQSHSNDYAPTLVNATVLQWASKMRRDSAWSDNVAVLATINFLQKPLVVWRVGTLQPPTTILPRSFNPDADFSVLHILQDETNAKSEHFTALFGVDVPEHARPIDGRTLDNAVVQGLALTAQGTPKKLRRRAKELDVDPDGEAENVAAPQPNSHTGIRKRIYGKQPVKMRLKGKQAAKHVAVKKQILKKPSGPPITDHQHYDAIVKRIVAGESIVYIQQQVKVRRIIICQIMDHLGRGRLLLTPDQGKMILELRNQKKSQAVIAKTLKISQMFVSRFLIKNGKNSKGCHRSPWHRHYKACFRTKTTSLPEESKWGKEFVKPSLNSKEELCISEWVSWGSWAICPDCGREQPIGKLQPRWWERGESATSVKCNGGCDAHPWDLSQRKEPEAGNVADESEAKQKPCRPYITPRKVRPPPSSQKGVEQWNNMFSHDENKEGKGDWPDEIWNLSPTEVKKLCVVTLKVKHSEVRGGNAPTTNKKKTGVVTAHWRRQDIEANLDSDDLRKAFKWLMKHNKFYAKYIEEHKELLNRESKPPDWFRPDASGRVRSRQT